jgi:hypothetical protein
MYGLSSIQQTQYDRIKSKIVIVLDQHAELDFYSASSLKQQFAGRHVAPLEHSFSLMMCA